MKIEDILENYDAIPETGCWLWSGAVIQAGYGYVRYNGKNHPAHRVVYEATKGLIPKGMEVRHKCDVRCCINPDHLTVGTHGQNMSDMVIRNRSMKGGKHHNSRLTDADVGEIRESVKSTKELSFLYGVGIRQINKIKAGAQWK